MGSYDLINVGCGQLDAGVPEKLILLSRDERSMLIASYADLKRCLETVYQELLARVWQSLPVFPFPSPRVFSFFTSYRFQFVVCTKALP